MKLIPMMTKASTSNARALARAPRSLAGLMNFRLLPLHRHTQMAGMKTRLLLKVGKRGDILRRADGQAIQLDLHELSVRLNQFRFREG
jgi:hypothetical protein